MYTSSPLLIRGTFELYFNLLRGSSKPDVLHYSLCQTIACVLWYDHSSDRLCVHARQYVMNLCFFLYWLTYAQTVSVYS
jgi:hypothetical protein